MGTRRTSLLIPQARDEATVAASWEQFVQDHALPAASVRNVVLESWRRCRTHAVDPGRAYAPSGADQRQMAQLREHHRDLRAAARPVLKTLRGVLRESGSLIVLTDPTGVVLDISGGSSVRDAGERVNLAPGGRWVETCIGTNAIGTAISKRKPVQIHASEHYCLDIKSWTCAAAPILDPFDKTLLGVLDVSGLKETFHGHTLGLVIAAAQQIESVLALQRLEQAMGQRVQSEKLASLGSLVAGVAHVLNTPLGNSLTAASALTESIDDFAQQIDTGALRKGTLLDFVARCREAARLVEKSSVRAADLIGHFKEVAVDQTGMRRCRFDLRQALDEVLATLRPQLAPTRHRLEVVVNPDIVLDSFPEPVQQITAQLVTNSLRHGFAGIAAGSMRIEAEALVGDQVALRYSDDGVGIPEAVAQRVFDPFFTTRLGAGGSGLGLYIVYNLVTAVLGGTIELSSHPRQGARFDIRLPRVAPQAAA